MLRLTIVFCPELYLILKRLMTGRKTLPTLQHNPLGTFLTALGYARSHFTERIIAHSETHWRDKQNGAASVICQALLHSTAVSPRQEALQDFEQVLL